MFLAFLRLLRKFWLPRATSFSTPLSRLMPAVEALEDRWLPSTIGGLVYFDSNNDGIHQSNEQGIAGNTIQLYNSAGTMLATTTTDSTGHYTFSYDPTVAPIQKTQEVDATFASARTNSTQTQTVAQFNPALGTLTSVEIINNGTLTSDLKVENDDSEAATITGTVNATMSLQAGNLTPVQATAANTNSATLAASDGLNDFASPSGKDFGSQTNSGSNDVTFSASNNDLSAFMGTGTVSLTEVAQVTSSISGAGNLLAEVSSQSSAQVQVIYHYETGAPLQPGNYTVVQPSDPPGYIHGLETNNNVAPIAGSNQTNSIAVQLGSSDSLNNNFGELKLSSVSGSVYYDVNNNGQYISGDPLLTSVTLNLSGTDDLGEQVTATQQTGANGSYQFNGLRPGNYTISIVQPSGYLSGTNTVGSLGGSVSGNTISLTVPWNATGTNYNFGEEKPPSVPTVPNNGITTPVDPPTPGSMLSKRDFIGGAWTKWGW